MSEPVDILFTHAHLFTMQGEGVGYIPDGALAVRGDRIVAVGTTDVLIDHWIAKETIDAGGHALLPGLIDAHMHTAWAVARGVAQDVAHWMQLGLAPFARHLLPAIALAGTRLNVLEALRSGTTTMGDYAVPYDGWADIFVDCGVRAVLTPTIHALARGGMVGLSIGELYPLDEAEGDRSIQAAVAFGREWHNAERGRITVMYGPQAPDMLSRDQLLHVKRLAAADGLRIHMHVAQGDREIDQMLKRYGKRTPDYLEQIGYLDEQLLAVHLTEASEEEATMIAYSGASMVLCSGSIGIIDGIVPPAQRFRASGGLVALGSDQAAGNNCNNIFNEMKLTALFNKIKHRDPTVMPAWEVLRMATIEGARAIGLGDTIGSLEIDKQADLILVDLAVPHLTPVLNQPIRNIVPNLVYAATGKEVVLSMVAGRILMRNGCLLDIDEELVRVQAQEAAEELAAAVERDPIHRQLALMDAMDQGWL